MTSKTIAGKTWTDPDAISARHADRDRWERGGGLRGFLRTVVASFQIAREQRDLAALSDHSLKDIGLTRADVEYELRRPFWLG